MLVSDSIRASPLRTSRENGLKLFSAAWKCIYLHPKFDRCVLSWGAELALARQPASSSLKVLCKVRLLRGLDHDPGNLSLENVQVLYLDCAEYLSD